MHDGGQFKVSNLYRNLKNQEILQDPLMVIGDIRCTLYLIGDSVYPIRPYLIKSWKTLNDLQKRRFDNAINSDRIAIENVSGALKNRWRILKHFNSKIDRVARETVACCWLYNYYELRNEIEQYVVNAALCRDPLVRFGNDKLSMYKEGEQTKCET